MTDQLLSELDYDKRMRVAVKINDWLMDKKNIHPMRYANRVDDHISLSMYADAIKRVTMEQVKVGLEVFRDDKNDNGFFFCTHPDEFILLCLGCPRLPVIYDQCYSMKWNSNLVTKECARLIGSHKLNSITQYTVKHEVSTVMHKAISNVLANTHGKEDTEYKEVSQVLDKEPMPDEPELQKALVSLIKQNSKVLVPELMDKLTMDENYSQPVLVTNYFKMTNANRVIYMLMNTGHTHIHQFIQHLPAYGKGFRLASRINEVRQLLVGTQWEIKTIRNYNDSSLCLYKLVAREVDAEDS